MITIFTFIPVALFLSHSRTECTRCCNRQFSLFCSVIPPEGFWVFLSFHRLVAACSPLLRLLTWKLGVRVLEGPRHHATAKYCRLHPVVYCTRRHHRPTVTSRCPASCLSSTSLLGGSQLEKPSCIVHAFFVARNFSIPLHYVVQSHFRLCELMCEVVLLHFPINQTGIPTNNPPTTTHPLIS